MPWYSIADYWPKVEPLIQDAIDHGGLGWETIDVNHKLMLRQLTLWVVERGVHLKAAVVTGFEHRPNCKLVLVFFIGGTELNTWVHLVSHLEDWAKANGCVGIQGYGRLGWQRQMPDGWTAEQIVMRKVFEP